MKKESIKPCPFCGGPAALKDKEGFDYASRYFWIECQSCGVKTKTSYRGMSDKKPDIDVVSTWNKRLSK